VNPCAHRQFGDEYVASLSKENRSFGGDHLNLGVSFHDFLYSRQGQLMHFVVMGIALQVIDGVLPICRQDVLVLPRKTLVDLKAAKMARLVRVKFDSEKQLHTLAHGPVYNSAGANPCEAS
jgi:hypothetical protein